MELIAGDGGIVQLAVVANLSDEAADLVVPGHRVPDGLVRGVDAEILPEGLENLPGQLLPQMLHAVLVVRAGGVQVAPEEILLVRVADPQQLHVLRAPVHALAHVHARHGVQELVAALQSPLQQGTGVLAGGVGHVVGGHLHGAGTGRAQPHREAALQVEQYLGHVIAGVTQGQTAVRLGLTHQLVVGVVQQLFKVVEMF